MKLYLKILKNVWEAWFRNWFPIPFGARWIDACFAILSLLLIPFIPVVAYFLFRSERAYDAELKSRKRI